MKTNVNNRDFIKSNVIILKNIKIAQAISLNQSYKNHIKHGIKTAR